MKARSYGLLQTVAGIYIYIYIYSVIQMCFLAMEIAPEWCCWQPGSAPNLFQTFLCFTLLYFKPLHFKLRLLALLLLKFFFLKPFLLEPFLLEPFLLGLFLLGLFLLKLLLLALLNLGRNFLRLDGSLLNLFLYQEKIAPVFSKRVHLPTHSKTVPINRELLDRVRSL